MAMINTDQNLGKKGFISADSFIAITKERKSRNLNQEPDCRGKLLANLHTGVVRFSNFLVQLRATCPGNGAAHSGLDPPIYICQLSIKTIFQRHVYSPV